MLVVESRSPLENLGMFQVSKPQSRTTAVCYPLPHCQ